MTHAITFAAAVALTAFAGWLMHRRRIGSLWERVAGAERARLDAVADHNRTLLQHAEWLRDQMRTRV